MKRIHHLIAAALVAVAGWTLPATTAAQGAAKAAPAPAAAASGAKLVPGTRFSAKGADTCLECHDKEADTATYTTNDIFKGPHGHRRDKASPFGPGGLQCEACHGPANTHSTVKRDEKLTVVGQKRGSVIPVAQSNALCLSCHENRSRSGWHAAAHEKGGVACFDCHKLHTGRDPVMTKTGQPDVCVRCHQKQRADFLKASAHPLRNGLMNCSDCHNAHGSASPSGLLVKATVNQTCTSCHADKRGPLLWEHAPVAEDCLSCHTSHGSVRPGLLTKSAPLLCQQCHTASSHPSVARTSSSLPGGGGGGGVFTLAGSCTNCHSQVHGSNHPAGAKLMR